MKKVLFFLGSMKRGGAERVISILSRRYAEKGWDTNIALLLNKEVEYELDESTKIFDLSNNKSTRIQNIPYWIKSIRALVKNEAPDVIVCFAARINLLVLIACFGMNVSIIVSERNDPYSDGRGKAVDLLTNIFYPLADTIVFQTRRAQSYFGEKIVRKSVVIPNPIEVHAERNAVDSNKIVSVGRLEPQKNQQLLLDAFARLYIEHPELRLYIYGEGSLKETLLLRAKELGISENVFFEGNVFDIHDKIKDANFFVLSSDYEGLSNALLEAMMLGIPCISTCCAGSDEYIRTLETGLLVPVNGINELVHAMHLFMENDILRNKCAMNAQKDSFRYSATVVLKQWEQVIGDDEIYEEYI